MSQFNKQLNLRFDRGGDIQGIQDLCIFRALTNFEESKDDFVALLGDLKHENNPTGDHSFPELTPFPASAGTSGAMVTLESIPALEIAENLTFIEYKVFAAIPFWLENLVGFCLDEVGCCVLTPVLLLLSYRNT